MANGINACHCAKDMLLQHTDVKQAGLDAADRGLEGSSCTSNAAVSPPCAFDDRETMLIMRAQHLPLDLPPDKLNTNQGIRACANFRPNFPGGSLATFQMLQRRLQLLLQA